MLKPLAACHKLRHVWLVTKKMTKSKSSAPDWCQRGSEGLYFSTENFVMDAVTRRRLDELDVAMRADISRIFQERVNPVVARYQRALSNRAKRLAGKNNIEIIDRSNLSCVFGMDYKVIESKYRERSPWPIVVSYQIKAFEEFGINGLIYFVEKTSRYKNQRDIGYALALKLLSERGRWSKASINAFVRKLIRNDIEVTSQIRRRGRKPIGAVAMSDAERQSRYRENRRSLNRV